MKIQFLSLICSLSLFFIDQVVAADRMEHPSVSRRVIICDVWQWIGGVATTWGCLTNPRPVSLADGGTTDQAIALLHAKMIELEARVKKLEQAR